MVIRIFPPSTISLRGTTTLSRPVMDTPTDHMTPRVRRGGTFMRMTSDEAGQFDSTNQIDATVSRRWFVKFAAAASVLAGASPRFLMAETKEGMPQRVLGRTGEKVSAIGLGGYHIGKQADEEESIRIIRSAIDRGITFMDNCWDYNDGVSEIRMGKAFTDAIVIVPAVIHESDSTVDGAPD